MTVRPVSGPRERSSRNDNDPGIRHVVVQIPGLLVLERGGIVHFDIKAGSVDIELLAVSRDAEREARAARDLGLLCDFVAGQVDRPELAALVPVDSRCV